MGKRSALLRETRTSLGVRASRAFGKGQQCWSRRGRGNGGRRYRSQLAPRRGASGLTRPRPLAWVLNRGAPQISVRSHLPLDFSVRSDPSRHPRREALRGAERGGAPSTSEGAERRSATRPLKRHYSECRSQSRKKGESCWGPTQLDPDFPCGSLRAGSLEYVRSTGAAAMRGPLRATDLLVEPSRKRGRGQGFFLSGLGGGGT
jgi:hypothetical protein